MPDCRAGVPGSDWDSALIKAGGHFLQSSHWQGVQIALGASVLYGEEPGDWMWAAHNGSSGGLRYLYIPSGPTVIRALSIGECLAYLHAQAYANKISFVRFEPAGAVDLFALEEWHAREVKPVQPRFTWILDITDDEATLRRGLTKGHRGSINAAERKGLSFRRSTDPGEVAVLVALLRATAARTGFKMAGERYYHALASVLMPRGAGCLYIAETDAGPVAAAFGFDFAGVRHYAYAGADPAARPLSPQAPLVWRMILDAKAEGMRAFDFWGVHPNARPGHPWAGFTQFKKSFGGKLVERAGTFELPVRAKRHRAYRAMKFLARR